MIATISVLVLALVLAVVPHAEAKCAWVLWEEIEAGPIPELRITELPPSRWKLHVARQTQSECEFVLVRTWEAELEHSQPGPDKPGIKGVKSTPGFISVT